MIRFQVFEDRHGEWRWRAVDSNNRVVASGGEGFTRQPDAERAIRNLIHDSVKDEIEVIDYPR